MVGYVVVPVVQVGVPLVVVSVGVHVDVGVVVGVEVGQRRSIWSGSLLMAPAQARPATWSRTSVLINILQRVATQ